MYISDDLFPLLQPIPCNAKSPNIPIHPGNVHYLANFILIPVPPLTLDPFTLVVEQIVRSYSKFPLLLQGSLMHMPPIRITVRFQPVSGDSDPLIGIVMELMQTSSPFGIATTILHVVYLMAHMKTNMSPYHLSLLFNLKSQH